MSWYASCESGHPYWSGPDEDTYSDAQGDAQAHDQSVHGGVATAVVLQDGGKKGERYVNVEGEWYVLERGELHKASRHPAPQCQGNACGSVSVTFVNPGYDLSNHGNRRVRISIQWFGAGECMSPADVDLDPGAPPRHFANGGYCNPYTANYV
jgi:hypothetical protein